ncbi:MAG: hypothetical protein HY812_06020 [Planctomycetes bacterium]|nr:hypothetical protein [Planctomycetota bacterium]
MKSAWIRFGGVLVLGYGIWLSLAREARAGLEPPEIQLETSADCKLLGPHLAQGVVIDLTVAWREPGSLLDTVGIARAAHGSVTLGILQDGALELSVFLPDAAGAEASGWCRMRSAARLAKEEPRRVTVFLGPAAQLYVDREYQGKLSAPEVWPDQQIYLGDFPGDADLDPAGGARRGMVGGVRLHHFGQGDDDLQILTLHRRVAALDQSDGLTIRRLAEQQAALAPTSAEGLHARAYAHLRLGAPRPAIADLEASLALKDSPAARRDLEHARSLLEQQAADGAPRGGFLEADLPPAQEEMSALLDGNAGSVRLADGAQLSWPAGVVPAEGLVTLRRLESGADHVLYHIHAPQDALTGQAELELPVPGGADEPGGVLVLYMRDMDDPGTLLDTSWQPGDRTVRARVDHLCLAVLWFLPKVVAGAGAVLETGTQMLNSDARLQEAVDQMLRPDRELPEGVSREGVNLHVPRYDQGNTLLCWAASLAMLVNATRDPTTALERPFKPQAIAALVKAEPDDGLGAPRYWAAPLCEPWPGVAEAAGAEVEVQRWAFYPNLIRYVFRRLEERRPVQLSIGSQTHDVVVVGYDREGFLIQDPRVEGIGKGRVGWSAFFGLIKGNLQTATAVYTVVFSKPVQGALPRATLNAPTCEEAGKYNQSGCYFTSPGQSGRDPETEACGFQWTGKAPGGVRLVTGGGRKIEVHELAVSGRTLLHASNLAVANPSNGEFRGTIRISLLVGGQDAPRPVTVMEAVVPGEPVFGTKSYFSAGSGRTARVSLPQGIPLAPFLREEGPGPCACVLRLSLHEGNQEIDRYELPLTLRPFRIDALKSESGGGEGAVRLTGAGFAYGGYSAAEGAAAPVTLFWRGPAQAEREVPWRIESESEAVFERPSWMQGGALFLRAGDGRESDLFPLGVSLLDEPFPLGYREVKRVAEAQAIPGLGWKYTMQVLEREVDVAGSFHLTSSNPFGTAGDPAAAKRTPAVLPHGCQAIVTLCQLDPASWKRWGKDPTEFAPGLTDYAGLSYAPAEDLYVNEPKLDGSGELGARRLLRIGDATLYLSVCVTGPLRVQYPEGMNAFTTDAAARIRRAADDLEALLRALQGG